ncbi:MAG TPA: hypothetical protein VLY03_13760 [Bacteroidota bacterium]|nr:hypothetical protein [Bacteroidota bacterium]
MKYLLVLWIVLCASGTVGFAGEGEGVSQYYSGKIGFYHPSDGLNNGLILGADGITEFERYHILLSLDLDAYPKQSVSVFDNPQPGGGSPPDVTDQQLLLFPFHANVAYELVQIPDAEAKVYLGGGGGYYFYFYSATYQTRTGGLLGGSLSHSSDAKNSGGGFGTIFARIVFGNTFLEPRYFFSSKSMESLGGNTFTIDPSGFSVMIGLQYH